MVTLIGDIYRITEDDYVIEIDRRTAQAITFFNDGKGMKVVNVDEDATHIIDCLFRAYDRIHGYNQRNNTVM